jgi:hypothetical protein
MESKKINQLATELAPVLSDLTIIGDPTTGISKKITLSQMASLFTGTVEEYPNLASFPLVGTADTIYIALDTNIIYRWNTGTSAYVELSPNIVTSLVFSDANGFDGTISLVGSTATLTITTALTTGSVPFIGASGALSQDNANLFFDDTNNRLGINTNSPTTALDVFGSGIIGRINGTSTNNAFLGFASAGTNKWSIGNVQADHRFRIYNEATTSELVSLLETGEFGIGIANPTTKLHIDGGASALIANLDANVSVAKSISFRSDNSARINLEVSGTESGSNAGANFYIRRYSDAGALIDTPLTITRSTGAIGLATDLNGINATFTGLLYLNKSESDTLYTGAFLWTPGSYNFFNQKTDHSLVIGTYNANSPVAAITIVQSGAVTFASNISGTTASFSGKITSTLGNNNVILENTSATTGWVQPIRILNTTGHLGIWVEGSAGNDRIANSLAYSSGIATYTNTALHIGTNNAIRMTITGGGNIGVGVIPAAWASPAAGKVIQLGNRASIFSYNNQTYDTGLNLYFDGANYKYLETATASLFRQNSDGGFIFYNAVSGTAGNTISLDSRFTIAPDGKIGLGTDNPLREAVLYRSSGEVHFKIANGTTGQGTTDGFDIAIDSSGNAYLIQRENATMNFLTNGTERMRISSGTGGGTVLIGRTVSPGSSYTLAVQEAMAMYINANGNNMVNFFNQSGTYVASIVINSSTVSYGTGSDYRLKEDLKDFDGLSLLSKIKFYDFKFKEEGDRMTGVIAHELQEVVPYAVSGQKDEVDKEGNNKIQNVDYSKLVSIQGRAIQQLEERIKQLEAKLK